MFGNFPQWPPEPLPATKRVGDVEVTLEKLSTGHDNNTKHIALKGGGRGISFDRNQNSWSSDDLCQAHFTTAGLTNGVHLDLISARVDTGTNLATGSWTSGANERTYDYRIIPPEAQTADFTFAVQHSRWVEFTVPPEVGTARIERRREFDPFSALP